MTAQFPFKKEDSIYRGKRLGDMTRDELIDTCCEIGTALNHEMESKLRSMKLLAELYRPGSTH